MKPIPPINAMTWLPAREVLPSEAADFTPWLSENLELLADALGIAELTLVETESAVFDKRLDILATATGEDGNEYPVVIENQYGITDHKHLGQLITYLAKQRGGLAIWIVEEASEAHIAAVTFLNLTSGDDVGYVLAQVQFAPGPDSSYQVHFDVIARPNAFLRGAGGLGGGSTRTINEKKKSYLANILERTKPGLASTGLKNIRMHTRGAYIEMRFPGTIELDNFDTRLTIKVTKSRCSVGLHVAGFDSREANSAALDVIKEVYGTALLKQLPPGTAVTWHAGSAGAQSDFAGISLPDHGYEGGDVDVASDWARDVCSAWVTVVTDQPPVDFEEAVSTKVVDEPPPALELDD